MKIALVNAADYEMSPYLRSYQEFFDQYNVDYTIIEWRRDYDAKPNRKHFVSFNFHSPISSNKFKKFYDYWKFAEFVKKNISEEKYDRLVIFGYQITYFLSSFLCKDYSKKFVMDIRDYNGIYKYIRPTIEKIDNHILARVISSPGYKEWLNPVVNDIVCHNTTLERISLAHDITQNPFSDGISILTNGALRTFSMDESIVHSFAEEDVNFVFAGKGRDSDLYASLSEKNNKVQYLGVYKKEEEIRIAQRASFINIFLEDCLSYNTAMSNRFYLSIIAGVPMIVNSQNIQSKYIEKYNLGISSSSINSLPQLIKEYIRTFDIEMYNRSRKEIIALLKADINIFNKFLNQLVTG